MRASLFIISCAAMGLLGAGCLSPDPQPARPVQKAEVEAIEHADDASAELVFKEIGDLKKKFRASKDLWSKKGTTKVGAEGLEVKLGKVEKSTRIELVFGNASFYTLTFFNGTEQVGRTQAVPRIKVQRKRLVIRRVKVPNSAVTKGYDRIVIAPKVEKRLSIGSVRVLSPKEAAKWDRKPKPKPAAVPAGTGSAKAPAPAPGRTNESAPKPAG